MPKRTKRPGFRESAGLAEEEADVAKSDTGPAAPSQEDAEAKELAALRAQVGAAPGKGGGRGGHRDRARGA